MLARLRSPRLRHSASYRAEINVTPLVDVVLVLLIIFMVITPMLQRGVDLRLPEALHYRTTGNPSDPIVVSVNSRRQLFVGQDRVTIETLPTRLRQEFERTGPREILLKGDGQLGYGQLRVVLRVIRRMGVGSVALATARPGSE